MAQFKHRLQQFAGSRRSNILIGIWAGCTTVAGFLYAPFPVGAAIFFCCTFSALAAIYASEQYRLSTAQYKRVAEMVRVLTDNTEARVSLTEASMELERSTRDLHRRTDKILSRREVAA